jgi:hypothetical protein
MKLPLRMLIPIAWRGMQPHRVREWRIEDLIVGPCNGSQQPFNASPRFPRSCQLLRRCQQRRRDSR